MLCLQSSGDPVLAAEFHPVDRNTIVTCGKGHINFWSLEHKNTLVKRMGVFDVSFSLIAF